jgi:hypothetical protein
VIGVGQKSLPKFLNEFGDEIAHNKPLDVAMFDAYRTIFDPKGTRGDDLAPLVLLAPRTNQQTAFDGIRVQNRVREFAARLNRLPGNVVVGKPPAAAQHIGINRSFKTIDEYRKGVSQAIENDDLNFTREIFGSKGLRSTTKIIENLEKNLSISPSDETFESATNETASAPDSQPFSAFPRLDAPAAVEAEKSFEVEVGFSDVPDPTQPDQKKITISDAQEDEEMLVVVFARNGWVDGPNHALLGLKIGAAAKFSIRAAANYDFVEVTAEYFFRNVYVGAIVKAVPVAGRPAPQLDYEAVPNIFRPILKTVERAGLDLVLMVKRAAGTEITWQALTAKCKIPSEPYVVDVGDAKQFASQLDKDQKQKKYTGAEGHTVVKSIGQFIADNIPPEIQTSFLAPCLQKSEAPRIMILTNEPYIPWELALLQPSITGRKNLEYLGAVARIGRWFTGAVTPAPDPDLKIGAFSVVCAETYTGNKKPLPQAIAERDWLKGKYKDKVSTVLGNRDPVIEWISSLPNGPGHLAHLALHGYSNPTANDQLLILGDDKNLTPADLTGGPRLETDMPKYGMVFLNACQVGTAGVTLGQFAGFPGALLRAGTNAVIGPIWEVNDVAARELVEEFYENTLEKGVPVSEALRKLRAGCDPTATTTPLAYIFYGHPDLVLKK